MNVRRRCSRAQLTLIQPHDASHSSGCTVPITSGIKAAFVVASPISFFRQSGVQRNFAGRNMMAGRTPVPDNPLGLSWHDSAWIPILNPSNIMEYFSERSNPFFDRTCNNEIVKMQRLNPDQLTNMTGLEYILLHVQEPILYVIRKQHRYSPTQATPLADYYIIAGVVYQAPDLASVVNSRLLSTVHHVQSAFEEASACSRYHPSKGYSWDFKNGKSLTAKKEVPSREEPSSVFQRQRVDMLLAEITRKFPLPVPKPAQPVAEPPVEIKQEIKVEKKDMKPPPERKPRAN